MLLKIRDAVQGWIAGVIVAIIALAFVFFGLESYLQRSSGSEAPVVTINGNKVSQKEFSSLLANIKSNYKAQSGEDTVSDQTLAQMKQYLLQEVIMNDLLSEMAAQYGFNVGLNAVKQYIVDSNPDFEVNGQFSQEKFDRFLYSTGMSALQLFAKVKDQLIRNQLPLGISQSAFLTNKELSDIYKVQYQSRDFGYFLLPIKQFDTKAGVTDKETKAYYDSNKQSFKTPEMASFHYLLVSPSEIKKQVHVTDDDARDYYKQHLNNFTKLKQWDVSVLNIAKKSTDKDSSLVSELYEKIKKTPDSMKAIASQQGELSQQVVSASSSADLYNAVRSLDVGGVSSPLVATSGSLIIKVNRITPAKVQSFDEVKSKVTAALKGQKIEEIFSQDSHLLSEAIFSSSSSLDEAAKQLSLPVKTSDMIGRSGAKDGVFSESKVLDVAFSDDVYSNGYNSSVISLKDGSAVALRLDKKKPSEAIPFKTVSEQIKAHLKQDKAQKLAGVAAYRIQSSLDKGGAIADLSKTYSLTWRKQSAAHRSDKKPSSEIVGLVFDTVLKDNKPTVNNRLLDDQSYLIVKVDRWVPGDSANMTKDQRSEIEKNALSMESQLYYLGYVDEMRDKAKIKINDKVLNTIK